MPIGLNRLSSLHIPSWHITLFTVFYLLSEILRIPDDGRKRNLDILYSFFFQETHGNTITKLQNPRRKFLKNSVKVSPLWLGSEDEYIFLKKINIERKTQAVNT